MQREYPARPWVGVGVVVFHRNQVLLIRRGQPPREGQWGLPGGAQKLGETLFDAAAREVLEETGLVVQPTAVITAVDGISRDAAGTIRFHYTLIEVIADSDGGEPTPGDDADAALWVPLEDVSNYVEWSETLRVIMLAAEQRRGG